MGFTFLAPLFLVGAAALAVPVIIHLVHRQRPQGVPFPSLMFLQRIPRRAQRRQKIRHWLLFTLRCLALLLVVLAFARPLLERSAEALAGIGGGRDVMIMVDRSLSMGYGDRWSRAVEEARRIVDQVGPDDVATVIAFDERADALNQPTADPVTLRAAVDGIRPGARRTRYSPALKLAQSLFDVGTRPRREIVLITDFQRSGWEREDVIQFAANVTVTPVDVGGLGAANVGVAAVTSRHEARGDRERAQISARLVNTGGDSVTGLPVALELNGSVLETVTADLAPHDAASVVFEPVLLPEGQSRGVVRIASDALEADDAFHFALSPGQALAVLVLEGSPGRANQSLYFARALGVGRDPSFRVEVKPIGAFQASDLDGRAIVVFNEAPIPSGTAGTRLREFVEAGGGVLVVLGERSGALGSDAAAALLPGTVGARVEAQEGRGGRMTHTDFGHPVFDVFSAPRSGDFSGARVFRYRALDVAADRGTVLARFDDGATAMAERVVGEGRVLAWTTSLDTYWNDLALQPVYLPFVHQVARHLAGYAQVRPWFTVGAVAELPGYAAAVAGETGVSRAFDGGGEVLVASPSGTRRRLAAADAALLAVDEPGFYEIRAAEGDARAIALAANVDPVESDLTPVDAQEFISSLSATAAGAGAAAAAPTVSLDDQERRQAIWWYLLVTALALFAVETLLSNRLSRVTRYAP